MNSFQTSLFFIFCSFKLINNNILLLLILMALCLYEYDLCAKNYFLKLYCDTRGAKMKKNRSKNY